MTSDLGNDSARRVVGGQWDGCWEAGECEREEGLIACGARGDVIKLPTFAADSCPDGVASICPSEAVSQGFVGPVLWAGCRCRARNKSDWIGAVVRNRDTEAGRWLLWASWW